VKKGPYSKKGKRKKTPLWTAQTLSVPRRKAAKKKPRLRKKKKAFGPTKQATEVARTQGGKKKMGEIERRSIPNGKKKKKTVFSLGANKFQRRTPSETGGKKKAKQSKTDWGNKRKRKMPGNPREGGRKAKGDGPEVETCGEGGEEGRPPLSSGGGGLGKET